MQYNTIKLKATKIEKVTADLEFGLYLAFETFGLFESF